MTLAARITRHPIAYEPDRGADAVGLLPAQPPEIRELLQGAAGCSPYLAGLIARETDWLAPVLSGDPETALAEILSDIAAMPPDQHRPGLRQAKRRVALLTALCDLGGVWDLETVTGALTDFADASVESVLRALVAAEVSRGKLPGATADDVPTAAGMVVLAMGKMGAHELNYSSDIDLICLFDQSRFDPADYLDARAAFVRVTRKLTATLSDLTGDGYVLRTDLRLRPDAAVTPVCMAMEPAERYYESLGRTWERAAHIKARPCAGDLAAGWAYLDRLRPFVWRKHLDFAAIQDAHDMRITIRNHKGLHGNALEGRDLKLGAGGIREIEFFTQTRQLIAGGRDPDLRVRDTVTGLARLADKGWIPVDVAETLTREYRHHREVEHRLQMINDAQTHTLPKTEPGFDRLARFMGQGDTAALRADLADRLNRVASLAEGFFTPGATATTPVAPPEGHGDIVERWTTYPALRSARAVEIFQRLKPDILARLNRASRPAEALAAFDGFLSGLPAGVQLFALFQANPQLVDLIVDIAATAPELALYLSRNAGVLDAVIGGDFFADWPGQAGLAALLAQELARFDDYERQLDAARRWKKEWHFRIGVHLLRGLIDPETASAQYADLAAAVVHALWDSVVASFAQKHGMPPGNGAMVLGMGSLGAGALTARSDLDLIVIYDPADVEASDCPRPLPSRTYYARLTQALVTALSAPMAEGKLYEVDMRLRPSGNQGPVATSLKAFRSYQRKQAWVWEHLALTRARPVAGSAPLCARVERFRARLLADKADRNAIIEAVIDMRARLAGARPVADRWETKAGPGRAQDIELIAGACALAAGNPATQVGAQLRACPEWVTPAEAATLSETYDLLRRVQVAGKLLSEKPLQPETLGNGARDFLLRATDTPSPEQLGDTLDSQTKAAADLIATILTRKPEVT